MLRQPCWSIAAHASDGVREEDRVATRRSGAAAAGSRRPTPPAPPPPPPAPPPRARSADGADRGRDLREDDARRAEREGLLADVFFALRLDRVDRSRRAAALQKNADYLKRCGTTKVMVEGHADSRGTNEYNLALGERRADATRDYLVSLGVPTTASRSSAKAKNSRSAARKRKACWQQNRRGHFIFTASK